MTISISLPSDAKIRLKAGQTVDFKTPLIDIPKTDAVVLPAAQELGIAPKDIFLAMQKTVGEQVTRGETLAQKRGFLSNKSFVSPVDGVIKEINHEGGTIIVQAKEEVTDTVTCFFTGEVESIEKNELRLKVKSAKEYPVTSATQSFGGPFAIVVQEQLLTITEDEVKGKVIYIEDLTSYDQSKIEALGAAGFLTNKMNEADEQSKAAVLGKGITGKELADSGKSYCIIDKKSGKLYLYE